jgi:hypothetical protein
MLQSTGMGTASALASTRLVSVPAAIVVFVAPFARNCKLVL